MNRQERKNLVANYERQLAEGAGQLCSKQGHRLVVGNGIDNMKYDFQRGEMVLEVSCEICDCLFHFPVGAEIPKGAYFFEDKNLVSIV